MHECKHEDLIRLNYEVSKETRVDVKSILQRITAIETKSKVTSSIYGALAGAIVASIPIILACLKGK